MNSGLRTSPRGIWVGLLALMGGTRGRRLGLGLAIVALAALPASLTGEPAAVPPCRFTANALNVDASITGASDSNGVLEPGETVGVRPSWSWRRGSFPCFNQMRSFAGNAAALTGPAFGGYVIEDNRMDYFISSDFYAMSVSAPAGRPAAHWDASFTEYVFGCVRVSFSQCANFTSTKDWTLHVGDSFTDVARSNPFYQKIETLLHKGITSGCSPTEYCPGQDVSRGQIATFLAKGLAGTAANVPASGTLGDQAYDCSAGGTSLFTDVAPTDAFCKHIHYLAAKNVDPGCDPGLYCPGHTLTRLQMAAFVANALVQPGGDAAVPLTYDGGAALSYSCDPASPNVHFSDVPLTDPLCKHANYLWARGIIAGCSPTEYCPAAEVTREQMAKFLVNAFRLKLYGP